MFGAPTITRHVGATILRAAFVVLVVLLGLVTIFTLVEELGDDLQGYDLAAVFQYVLWTLPRRAYELLPYVAFIGALLGLGQLASQSELVVVRAAGFSAWRIFAAACLPAVAIAAGAFALGEWLAPAAETRAEAVKARVADEQATVYIDGGHWYREGALFLNVDAITRDGVLLNVLQYQLRDDRSIDVLRRAQSARYLAERSRPADGVHIWRFQHVEEVRFDDERATRTQLPDYEWRSGADPLLLSARALLEPGRMSLADLEFQVAYMQREGLEPTRYRLAYWSKLQQPLAILGLTLVALGFVLGPLRERGIAARTGVGVLAGLAFKYLQDLFAPISLVYGLAPWLGVLIPILCCWLVGALLVRRVA
ncbi:MAG: LPS export ABC transporter permease LptG [Pseudomonadota bacterium]